MNKLAYIPASSSSGEVPAWIDGALRKAVQIHHHHHEHAHGGGCCGGHEHAREETSPPIAQKPRNV